MKLILRALVVTLLTGISLLLLGVVALAALHQQWIFAVVAGLFFLGALPLRFNGGLQRMSLLLGLVCLMVFAQAILDHGDARLTEMGERVRAGGALRREELAGVYALGLVMVAGAAAAGYPEIAREQWQLYHEGPAERPQAGDFPLEAPPVRAALRAFLRKLQKDPRAPRLLPLTVVPIPYTRATMRYALALDPVRLTASAERAEALQLNVTARVDCRFNQRARVPLFVAFGKTYAFDHGLFYALQQQGLLHPYTAVWQFSVKEDDPRLK